MNSAKFRNIFSGTACAYGTVKVKRTGYLNFLSVNVLSVESVESVLISVSELFMGWVDPFVGLGWVQYSKSTKILKGLCQCI